MKKLLILALLIASVTFIFAAESEFSDVVGYVKYELTASDYNMIALPMDTGITTASDLAVAISPDVTAISVWDNETHSWEQYSVSVVNTDFEINHGDALLIYLDGTANFDFYCAGTLPTQANYDLVANDYNSMMLPLNRSEITTTSEFATAIGGGVTAISTWDNETHGWKQYSVSVVNTDFEINIGAGFLIFSNEAYEGWNAPISRTMNRTAVRK